MPDAAIWTEGVTKKFGDEFAVRGVSFEVESSTIFGFIGPSGGGKTTTIRLLSGIQQATSGDIRVLGRSPSAFNQAIQARIGYMPQHFALYPDLTIWENLNFAASLYGLSPRRRKRMEEVLDFVELKEHRGKSVRKISGGMKRRLSLAATLIHRPDLFFLDEPTGGIDPVLRQKFWDHFRELKQEGRTLFVTTQYVSEAAYCDKVGVLVEGELLTVDTPVGLRYQAFGGDIVKLESKRRLSRDVVEDLKKIKFVTYVDHVKPTHLRIGVEEAAVAFTDLVKWTERHDIDIVSMEEHLPPFDDVFVALIEKREREQNAD